MRRKPRLSIRVIQDEAHLEFLRKTALELLYFSNPSGKGFDEAFAREKADVIVFTCKGFFESKPSSILDLVSINLKNYDKDEIGLVNSELLIWLEV